MAPSRTVIALTAIGGLIAAAAPASVVAQERMAPAGGADTRYCMKIDALTGSNIPRVKCWTREQWEAQGVDLDRDWPKEGVRTIG